MSVYQVTPPAVLVQSQLQGLVAAQLPTCTGISAGGGTTDQTGQIRIGPTDTSLIFSADLSAGDQATLAAIVAAYNPLSQVQAIVTDTLFQNCMQTIQAAFDAFTDFYLLKTLVYAWKVGLTNRANYIGSHDQWEGNIYNAFQSAKAVVNTAVTPAAALAVTLGPTQTETGNLSNTGTLSGLASTAQISVGMVVTGAGITGVASVATVPNGTSVTLTGGTYTTQTGQSYTFALPAAPNVTIQGATAINN